MVFERSEGAGNLLTKSHWHHNIFSTLVEVSDPVSLDEECDGDWSYVSSKFTPLNYLAYAVPGGFIGIAAFGGGGPWIAVSTVAATVNWQTQTVEVGCAGADQDPIQTTASD